jgi:two-component system response regulator DevR
MMKTTREECRVAADAGDMNTTRREEILDRFREHASRFDSIAESRPRRAAEIIPIFPFPEEPIQPLSTREGEVLQLIADGLTNREISTRLWISEETVKTHVRNILAKLRVASRAHAVAEGFRSGAVA